MSIDIRVNSEADDIAITDWVVPPECYRVCPPHDMRHHNEQLADIWFTVGVCLKCGQIVSRIPHLDD